MTGVAWAAETTAAAGARAADALAAAESGPVVTATLGLLVVMSIATWAILGVKLWAGRRLERADGRFLSAFYRWKTEHAPSVEPYLNFGPDGSLFVTDSMRRTVYQFTPDFSSASCKARLFITVASMPMWSPVTRSRPAAWSAAPRNRLPPPTTRPT